MLQVQKFTPRSKGDLPKRTYVKCRVPSDIYEKFTDLIETKGWSRDSSVANALSMFVEAFGGKKKAG